MSKAWMPLYIGDYLADTADLTQGEHGAYLLLLMHCWQKGFLPANEKLCCRIAKADTPQSRKNVVSVRFRFFYLADDGNYHHKRIDKELLRSQEISEKRTEAVNKRWANEPSKSNTHVSTNGDTKGIPSQSHSHKKEKHSGAGEGKVSSLSAQQAAWFEEIWQEYPRKEGMKDALRHFKASVKNENDLSDVKRAIENYKRRLAENNTQQRYIKMGSTWFNNWRDYLQGENSSPKQQEQEATGWI